MSKVSDMYPNSKSSEALQLSVILGSLHDSVLPQSLDKDLSGFLLEDGCAARVIVSLLGYSVQGGGEEALTHPPYYSAKTSHGSLARQQQSHR